MPVGVKKLGRVDVLDIRVCSSPALREHVRFMSAMLGMIRLD